MYLIISVITYFSQYFSSDYVTLEHDTLGSSPVVYILLPGIYIYVCVRIDVSTELSCLPFAIFHLMKNPHGHTPTCWVFLDAGCRRQETTTSCDEHTHDIVGVSTSSAEGARIINPFA